MKFWPRLINSVLVGLVVFIVPAVGSATTEEDICGPGGAGEAVAEEYVSKPEGGYSLEQPIGGKASVQDLAEYIQLVYQFALGIVGLFAVVLIMFGGMQWVTAAGNEQKITSAKEIITSALAGLIIALLSYTILLLINPATVNIGVDVFKIPVQYQCPYTVEVIPIPTVQGLSGNGAQACPNVAAGLVEVAQNMVANICASCTIQVGSAYRSPEQQAPLYECYQKCVDEGYIDSAGTTRKKEGFPSGCHSCNKAAKPCCSNHQKGVAVDLWYDYGGGDPLIAPTSKGKLSQSYNNGGGDEALANNQFELQQVMTATGKFSPISVEWWHFDLKSKQCGLAATNCQVVGTAGSTIANNAYCYTTRPSDNLILYKAARCNGNVPACDPSSGLTWYTASTGSDCDFTSFVDSTPDPRSVNVYTTKPSCVYNDRGRVD